MEEFRRCFPAGVKLSSPPASLLDEEAVVEMGHELDVLLLLLHPDHFQLFAEQGLELLLQAEGESQPPHVARIATLQDE